MKKPPQCHSDASRYEDPHEILRAMRAVAVPPRRHKPGQPESLINRRHRETMERYQDDTKPDDVLAISSALGFCLQKNIPIPRWLGARSLNVHLKVLTGNLPKQLGRSNGPVARRRRDNIDHARWGVVTEVRERRPDFIRQDVDLAGMKGRLAARARKEIAPTLELMGKGDLGAFECAAFILEGTPAQGGPAAMQRSFRKVEKALKSKRRFSPYCALEMDFEIRIGTWIDTIK